MCKELLDFLSTHVEVDEELTARLRHERLTLASFYLLSEQDLKELGFAMGPRKILSQVIRKQDSSSAAVAVPALSVAVPSSSTSIGSQLESQSSSFVNQSEVLIITVKSETALYTRGVSVVLRKCSNSMLCQQLKQCHLDTWLQYLWCPVIKCHIYGLRGIIGLSNYACMYYISLNNSLIVYMCVHINFMCTDCVF